MITHIIMNFQEIVIGRNYLKNSLVGLWEYTAVSSSAVPVKHHGICKVAEADGELAISGHKFSEGRCLAIDGSWYSIWADLCHDQVFRFSYKISIGKHKELNAVAEIDARFATNGVMTGKVFIELPEGALMGTITFQKLIQA